MQDSFAAPMPPTGEQDTAIDTDTTIDMEKCRELLAALDHATLAVLLDAFLHRLPLRRTLLESQLAANDRRQFCITAHSLKGAASSLGCSAISRLAQALEEQALSADKTQLLEWLGQLAHVEQSSLQTLRRMGLLDMAGETPS